LTKKELAQTAIKIERQILKESGGIQDQIWAAYGGFNSIEIKTNGDFAVKPMPISSDFKDYFEKCLSLIYVDTQRKGTETADSHKNKDKTQILKYAHEAYEFFVKEDTESIFDLVRHSWKEKKSISNKISNKTIDALEQDLLAKGVKAVKLLGSGGRGFILCFSYPPTIKKIEKDFEERVLKFKFENEGTQSKFETP
jgi:D-glycero-alpha-D-manno-heptose-7-phosphate kinase